MRQGHWCGGGGGGSQVPGYEQGQWIGASILIDMYIVMYRLCLLLLVEKSGSRDGAVVRALASHRCVPGSIPGPGVVCGLSLFLVPVHAPRVFLRVLRFFSLQKNQHL